MSWTRRNTLNKTIYKLRWRGGSLLELIPEIKTQTMMIQMMRKTWKKRSKKRSRPIRSFVTRTLKTKRWWRLKYKSVSPWQLHSSVANSADHWDFDSLPISDSTWTLLSKSLLILRSKLWVITTILDRSKKKQKCERKANCSVVMQRWHNQSTNWKITCNDSIEWPKSRSKNSCRMSLTLNSENPSNRWWTCLKKASRSYKLRLMQQ